jgi:arylsulfatase A-like enzyme
MPKLKEHFQVGGTRFNAHVADAPQCGPSRSSTLTGKLVHNHGYWINADPTKNSFRNWANDNNNTVGTWLTASGYHTAFLGKYINTFECVPNPISPLTGKQAWSYWYATCNTYTLYNTSYVDNSGKLIVYEGIYQTDTLSTQAIGQIHAAKELSKPFYIHITPVAPHASACLAPGGEALYPWCEQRSDGGWYCDKQPTASDFGPDGRGDQQLDAVYELEQSFTGESADGSVFSGNGAPDGGCEPQLPGVSPCPRADTCGLFKTMSNPHQPQWNLSMAGKPSFLNYLPPVPAQFSRAMDGGYQDRVRAVQPTDEMIDHLVQTLTELEMIDNTYMFYTADNGYHLGEHRLLTGKCEPFESDTHLTFWARGPGIAKGRVLDTPTQHTDFAITFTELAKTRPPTGYELDGHSLLPVLTGHSRGNVGIKTETEAGVVAEAAVTAREYTFSEFFLACSTWRKLRIAKYTDSVGVSRRLAFHAWCTNQTEAYDLDTDPYQLNDLSASLPTVDLRKLTALSAVIGECAGVSCSAPLAELQPLAEARVEAHLQRRAAARNVLRDDENVPTDLVCYNGVNTKPWCCGQADFYVPRGSPPGTAPIHEYDCADVVPP